MNYRGITLEPKLEELLRDVARDPDSCLLRVDKKASHRALFEIPEAVSENATSLTVAERDLARFYREEVAWLLLELCRYHATEDREYGPAVNSLVVETDHRPTVHPQDLQRRRRSLEPMLTSSDSESPLAQFPFKGLGEVSALAMRLDPSAAARGYQGIHLTNTGNLSEASRLLAINARTAGTARLRVSTLDCTARTQFLGGNFPGALLYYGRASRTDPSRVDCASFWLFTALLAEDHEQAVDALNALEAAMGNLSFNAAGFRSAVRQAYRQSGLRPSIDRAFALKIYDRASAAGRQVIDEALQ